MKVNAGVKGHILSEIGSSCVVFCSNSAAFSSLKHAFIKECVILKQFSFVAQKAFSPSATITLKKTSDMHKYVQIRVLLTFLQHLYCDHIICIADSHNGEWWICRFAHLQHVFFQLG